MIGWIALAGIIVRNSILLVDFINLELKAGEPLEHQVTDPTEYYTHSGNVLLDRIFGANLREYPGGTDFDAAMEDVAEEVRKAGGKPYIIPGGASNPVGALGYVNCAIEMLGQFEEQDLDVSHIVTATGSAGTQGGLIVGLRAMQSDIPLLGIGQQRRAAVVEEDQVHRLGPVALAGLAGAAAVDVPLTMWLGQNSWPAFAEIMGRSLFAGEGPGGGDPAVDFTDDGVAPGVGAGVPLRSYAEVAEARDALAREMTAELGFPVEAADDAEPEGGEQAQGLLAGLEQAGDRTHDETEDEKADDVDDHERSRVRISSR